MSNTLVFVGGIRGSGKDFLTRDISLPKFYFYDILQESLEESWDESEVKIGEKLLHLIKEHGEIVVLLHYAIPSESAYEDLLMNRYRDLSDSYNPCLTERMLDALPNTDFQVILIYVDASVDRVIERSLRDEEKVRPRVSRQDLLRLKQADISAYRGIVEQFQKRFSDVKSVYLFNNKEGYGRLDLESLTIH